MLNKKIKHPQPYLSKEIWTAKGFDAIGFKILYHQAEKYKLWDYIKDFKIIHLIRHDKLDMLLSEELAKEHKCFISFDEKDVYTRPVRIDPTKLEKKIKYCKEMQEKVDEYNNRINVYYEDLKTDKILDFLGVQPAKLIPKTIKLTTKSKKEMILNWEEMGC